VVGDGRAREATKKKITNERIFNLAIS